MVHRGGSPLLGPLVRRRLVGGRTTIPAGQSVGPSAKHERDTRDTRRVPERNDAGGRAGAGGFDYQHRGGAWFAVHVLAGNGAAPTLSLWSTTLGRIDCETGEPVDDCRVTPVAAQPFALQFKRTLDLSAASDSELAKPRSSSSTTTDSTAIRRRSSCSRRPAKRAGMFGQCFGQR